MKTNLSTIQSMDKGDKIFQVLVPTEEEINKNGKRHPVEREDPGYVLVEMVMMMTPVRRAQQPGVTSLSAGHDPG